MQGVQRDSGAAGSVLRGTPMNYYLVTLVWRGKTVERGWMLAADDMELISYARTLGYGIDIEYLGRANMQAVCCEVLL